MVKRAKGMARTASASPVRSTILGFLRDNFSLKLCGNLLNRQQHARIDNVDKTTTTNSKFRCRVSLVLLLRQKVHSTSCVFPSKHQTNSTTARVTAIRQSLLACQPSVATVELPSSTVHHHTTRATINQRSIPSAALP